MSELHRIRDGYALETSEEFLAADEPGPMFTDKPNAMEGTGHAADLDQLDEIIRNVIESTEPYSTQVDRKLTAALHSTLGIDRRLGSDVRFWAWMGLVRYPQLVAWRWAPGAPREPDGIALRSRERFCGSHVRQCFSRLWWAAELTVDDEGDYSLTETLLALSGFQDAYEAFFGRAFCQYRPALKAFVETVGDRQEGVIREAARQFGYVMSSRVLETLSEEEIARELLAILRELDQEGTR